MPIEKDTWSLGQLVPIDDAELTRLGLSIRQELDDAIGDRSNVNDTIKRSKDAFEQHIKPKDFPYPGSSNVYFPMTTQKIFSIQTQQFPIFFQSSPFYVIRPLDAQAEQVAPQIEGWLDYKTRCKPTFLNQKYFVANYLSYRDGVGVIDLVYKDKLRKRRFFQDEFDFSKGRYVKRSFRETVSLFRGVDARPVQFEDFYLLPYNSRTLEEALGVAKRFWSFGYDIQRNIDQGNFYEQAKNVINWTSSRTDKVQSRQQESGGTFSKNPLYRQSELWEVVMPIELKDGDGRIVNEELFQIIIHKQTGIILRIELFPYDAISDKYHPFAVYPRPYDFYAFTVPELMSQLNPMMNAMLNNFFDNGNMQTNKPIAHLGDVFLNNKPIGSTTLIEVSNLDGFKQLDFGEPSQFPVEAKNLLQEFADKITGDFDLSSLAMMGTRKSSKEAQALMQMMAQRSQMHMAFTKQSLKDVGLSHISLELLYGEDNLDIPQSMTNVNETSVPKQILASKYDLEAGGGIRGYNEQEKQQTAMFVYDLLLKNPLIVGGQGIPPRLDRLWQVTHDLLESANVKNIEARIGRKEEIMQMMQQQQAAQAAGAMGPGQQTQQVQGAQSNMVQQATQALGGQAA